MISPYSRHATPDWVFPEQTRTRAEFPYSYSPHYLWRRRPADRLANGLYHDRMIQQDREAFADAHRRVGNARFDKLTPEQAGVLLSRYLGRPVVATALAEGCNPSNGYPYWIFWFENA